MNTLPFHDNLLLWRLARGLTQAELAKRAKMAQSNLSDIERGAQDVSLRTLRALALALAVRPGLLADGVPPADESGAPGGTPAAFDRQALERMAASVAGQRVVLRKGERELARCLGLVMQQRLGALQGRARAPRSGVRLVRAAWMTVQARYPKAVIDSLIQRISERAALRT